MYNRYIPQGDYESAAAQQPGGQGGRPPFSGGLEGILKALHLDRFDKGDILLLLVLLFLYTESNDEDWLIVLALVVLMGL